MSRILMLSQFYEPVVGGVERSVGELSRALVRRWHDVSVATIALDGENRTELLDGVRVHRIRTTVQRFGQLYQDGERPQTPPAPDPGAVAGIRRVLATESPDLVHAHDWFVHSYLPLARRRRPLVLSVHDHSLRCATKRLVTAGDLCSGPALGKCERCAMGHYGAGKGLVVSALRRLTSPALRQATSMYLPVSAAVAASSGLLVDGRRTRIIPNFESTAGPAEPADGGLELPDGPFVLFVGDVSEDKGAGVLLAARQLMRHPVDVVLAGRPLLDDLDPDRPPAGVHVLGMLSPSHVRAAMRRCAVLAVPSLTPETFCLTALEGMTAGAAIVASDRGNLPHLISHDLTGLVVPGHDAAALAAALDRVLADDALRARLGSHAMHEAARYAEDVVVPQYEQAYDDAMSWRRSPAEEMGGAA